MRQIFRRHGHGQRDGNVHLAAALQAAFAGGAQIGAAQNSLARLLRAVELQVKLELRRSGTPRRVRRANASSVATRTPLVFSRT